jgi:surface antigen
VVGVFVFANSISKVTRTGSYGVGFGGLVANSTIDEVATAQVAKQIAQGANLIIADNVTNLADSLEASVDFATTSDSYLAKPQIVSTDAKTREDIIEYTTKDGDSITELARQFGVTSDSIRWANDISGDLLGPGRKLKIPPVSGLIYVVKEGDTAASLANRFSANAEQITSFNDAEINGLKVGSTIVIPGGELQATTPAATQPVYFSSESTYSFSNIQPVYGGNGYSYGYCTWHAANRRAEIGRPIPRNLGNAVTWASIAAAAGLAVGEQPTAGAVLWHRNTYIAGGYGHVGFVEKINSDGSALVSDMNYPSWNAVTYRTIPPEEFSQYLFIY